MAACALPVAIAIACGEPLELSDGGTDGAADVEGGSHSDGVAPTALCPAGADAAPVTDCAGAVLTSSDSNCGECGHSCRAAGCTNGVCNQVRIHDGVANENAVTQVRDGIVYFASGNTAFKGATDGTGKKAL